jgi:hypothetical protein
MEHALRDAVHGMQRTLSKNSCQDIADKSNRLQ